MNAQPIDSAVLEGLYGAALHDDDWTAALERSLVLLRSADVSLSIADLGEFTFCASTGRLIGPDAQRSYLDHFHALDPKRPIFAAAGPGFLFNDTQHFDA
ncbi:MAG: hypothetical protein ACXWKN_14720, partial [Phenylobacterium sp.]